MLFFEILIYVVYLLLFTFHLPCMCCLLKRFIITQKKSLGGVQDFFVAASTTICITGVQVKFRPVRWVQCNQPFYQENTLQYKQVICKPR